MTPNDTGLSRRRFVGSSIATAIGLSVPGTALAESDSSQGKAAGGEFGRVFANGDLYRTLVVRPTDEPENGDVLYFIHDGSRGLQPGVSETAPTDAGYNGGQWVHTNVRVEDVDFFRANLAPLTSESEVLSAVEDYPSVFARPELGSPFAGAPPDYFLCPLTEDA